jgi:hypothetical protein
VARLAVGRQSASGCECGRWTAARMWRRWTRSHAGEADGLRVPESAPADLWEQLAASRAHLPAVEASYWERDWRSANRGLGVHPEHHLWDAVHGYLDLVNATSAARPGSRTSHARSITASSAVAPTVPSSVSSAAWAFAASCRNVNRHRVRCLGGTRRSPAR